MTKLVIMAKLLKAIIAASGLLSGGYISEHTEYSQFLKRYRPVDGYFNIGSPKEDRRNYCSDFNTTFNDYRTAASVYIESRHGKKKKRSK